MSEQFVDQAEKPIPPANTWDTLSSNQLLDVKLQLQERAWQFRNTPQIAIVLKHSLERLTALISERSSQ